MLGSVDLAGWASVLLAVSTVLGAVNAIIGTVLHRKVGANAKVIGDIQQSLTDSNRRVEGSYEMLVQSNKELLAYIQGLNTPRPRDERRHGDE